MFPLVFTDSDIDYVGIRSPFFHAGDAVGVLVERISVIDGGRREFVGWSDRDVDFGGDNAGGERVFVEGVEKAFKFVAALVDGSAGSDIDCKGKDNSNPRVR